MQPNAMLRIALISSFVTLFVVVVIGGGGYFVYTRFVAPVVQNYLASRESNAILSAMSKVVLLPPDETPQITTILDVAQLKAGDQFFTLAKNGDAVAYYPISGMIILFDMKNHKLLNMGTIATTSSETLTNTPIFTGGH